MDHNHQGHDHSHGHHHHDGEPEFTAEESAQIKGQLKKLFDGFPKPLELVILADPKVNQPFAEALRQVIGGLRQLTDRIGLREFGLDDEMARQQGATASPTLLMNPGEHRVRWLGAPLGEEGSAFLEAVIMLGYRQSTLSEQSKKVLADISEPRDVKVFVSLTCPYCPAQIINALKAAVQRPQLIGVEIIDIQANQDMAEKYDAFSTPTVYANGRLIAKGAQPEELFMASLKELEQQSVFIPDNDAPEIKCDLVIVGGGPAGLTAAIYSARNGLKAVVVEKGALGGQVATTPVVENYPGFTSVGGKALVDIMVAHALQYANIFPGEEVVEIAPGDPMFVTTTRRRFKTRRVLLATGASHKKLGAPGENRLAGRGVSYCSTCDGPLFKGKRAVIVGGGDSALTEAIHLANIGVKVSLIHRRDALRAQAHLVKGLADNGVPVIYNSQVTEILGRERVSAVRVLDIQTNQETVLATDAVFIAIGYSPVVELALKAGVRLDEAGYIQKDAGHLTNVPGIYSAGDVTGGYKQIVTAAGQGAEAAMAIFREMSLAGKG